VRYTLIKSSENKERNLKATGQKQLMTFRESSICLMANFSSEAVVMLGTGAHTYNHWYSGGRDWEDLSLRSAWAKSLQDPHFNQ
jgi:hypothetical protein